MIEQITCFESLALSILNVENIINIYDIECELSSHLQHNRISFNEYILCKEMLEEKRIEVTQHRIDMQRRWNAEVIIEVLEESSVFQDSISRHAMHAILIQI